MPMGTHPGAHHFRAWLPDIQFEQPKYATVNANSRRAHNQYQKIELGNLGMHQHALEGHRLKQFMIQNHHGQLGLCPRYTLTA